MRVRKWFDRVAPSRLQRPVRAPRLLGLMGAATLAVAAAGTAQAGAYEVGSGVYDITGSVAEAGMFGYAAGQEVDGLHQRVRARAFIIKNPGGAGRIVFVSADLGAVFQSIKLEVVRRLQQRYGSTYTHTNVMLTATHTHVGPGGMSHYALYQLASVDASGMGYSSQNFEAAVDGIVQAIVRAHNDLAPGSVEMVQGDLLGASRNRSLAAYQRNPDAGQHAYDTNKRMVMLKLRHDSGRDVGVINWFAVHPTSFSLKFTKISGDNKGYAQDRFERAKSSDYAAARTFVAAFANSDEGDAVPSDGSAFADPGFEGSPNEYANAEAAGSRQFDRAWALYQSTGVALSGAVDARHQWRDMRGLRVDGAFTDGRGPQTLCSASRGYSFAAGAENGPSHIPGITEGMTRGTFDQGAAAGNYSVSFQGQAVQALFGVVNFFVDDPCQYPKPNLLATGAWNWVPQVLPHQVFVMGRLAIVGLPYEPTTAVGRRIRAQVGAALASRGVTDVVIAGLANSYSGYLTTYEEYQAQHYEGASTEFGPNTLAATQQVLADVTGALVSGTALPNATPPDLRSQWRSERAGVWFDDVPWGQQFGQVLVQPQASYARGSEVTVTFRGAHPKNNPRRQGTFLAIERWTGSQWATVARDWDWDTTYRWRREGAAYSQVDVIWRVPSAATPGTYRVRQFGDWKSGWTLAVQPYSGTSRNFTVQ